MEPKPQRASLEDYGRAFQQVQMRPEMDQRIRRRLNEPMAETQQQRVLGIGLLADGVSRGSWAAAGVLVLTCAFFLAGQFLRQNPGRCTVDSLLGMSRYQGGCEVELDEMSVTMGASATLLESEGRVGLRAGDAHFLVRKVAAASPAVVVHVPEGRIEVLGTEFDVRLSSAEGELRLQEGRIRFVSAGQAPKLLEAGEHWTWRWHPAVATEQYLIDQLGARGPRLPLVERGPSLGSPSSGAPSSTGASSAEQSPKTSRPVNPLGTASKPAAADGPAARPRGEPGKGAVVRRDAKHEHQPSAALSQLMALRGQGKFAEAVRVLDGAAAAALDDHTREVLSFERGMLLDQLDSTSACEQFALHFRKFKKSRYVGQLRRRLKRCASEGLAEEREQ